MISNCIFCNQVLSNIDKYKMFFLCDACPVRLVYANDTRHLWYFWNFNGEYFVTVHPGSSIVVSAKDEENIKLLFKDEDVHNLHPQNVQPFLDKILSMKAFI